MKALTAKYAGKCSGCKLPIVKGERIAWAKATGARHLGCASTAPTQRAVARAEIDPRVRENLLAGRCPDGCCGPGADMPWTSEDEREYQAAVRAEGGRP